MAQAGVIRDFMVALGFKTDNSGLGKMQDAMKGIEGQAKLLNGALMALATGAVIAVRQTASELDKLYFSSQRIGASANNINAYGNAIAQLGGNAEGAVGSLESLAEKMRNSPGYESQINSLGVNTKEANGSMRDRVEVMKDLSGVLSKMPAYQANAYASSLGIDQNTLLAMRDGKFMANMDKYQKIQKELGMSDDLTKSGNEFMTEYRDLTMMTKTGFQVIVMQAGKALIPILKLLNQLIMGGISAFSQLNPQIKEGLAIGLRFALVSLVFGAFIKTFGLLFKFIPMIKGFIGLLKLFRLAFLASPIGIILALASALYLLYDDYKTWRDGGKSLFDWSKWTNGIDTIINKIKEFLEMLDQIKDKVVNFVQKVISDPIGAVQEVVETAKDAVKNKVAEVLTPSTEPANDTVKAINDVSKSIVDTVKDGAKKAAEVAVGVAKVVQGEVKGVASNGSGFTKTAPIRSGAKGEKQIDFIKKYWGMAVRISEALGVNPEVILSQFAAETGWGKSVVPGTNNLGNIKAGKSWKGKTVKAYDKIEKSNDPYRVYATPEEFAEDYIKLVGKSKRYKNVIGSHTAEKFYTELKKAGYATDKDYVSKGVEMNKSVMNRLDMTKVKLKQAKNQTPKNSKDLANFAQDADMPNIQSYAPPSGNPHRGQISSSNLSASNITIHQSFKTDMNLNGVTNPMDAANAVKRQQENSLAVMARNAMGPLVG